MSVVPQGQDAATIVAVEPKDWSLGCRILFRFGLVYLVSFCLMTQTATSLVPWHWGEDWPTLGMLPPFRQLVEWTAKNVFNQRQPVFIGDSGSGDKTYDWVLTACLATFACLSTILWSVLAAVKARRREYYVLWHWFRVFLRFALAGQMIVYGIVKVIPLQMGFPSLQRLLEPFGDFSPMAILWASVGAAPAYERFAGAAELAAGLLLVIPRTAMLGAAIAVFDMVEVFVLNMTYDVPVKLYSFHLLVIALVLLIPERKRLVRFCFGNCAIEQPVSVSLFASKRANRLALLVQVIFGLLLVNVNVRESLGRWSEYGGGAPRSPFYGIWTIDEMRIGGVVRAPLLTDYDRWRRVIFDHPDAISFQRMDDTFNSYRSELNNDEDEFELSKANDSKWKGFLRVKRESPSHLSLEGEMNAKPVMMKVSLVDRKRWLLLTRGFHWVQEYPYVR